MPVIRVIKKSSSRNILSQSRKHLLKTRKRSKRSRKLRNSLTHHARLNKLQYGGSEHINQVPEERLKRAEERRQKLLQKGRISPQPGMQQVASTLSSSSNIMATLKSFLMRK